MWPCTEAGLNPPRSPWKIHPPCLLTPPPGLPNTKIDSFLIICLFTLKIQTHHCTQKATTASSRVRREGTHAQLGSTAALPTGGAASLLCCENPLLGGKGDCVP